MFASRTAMRLMGGVAARNASTLVVAEHAAGKVGSQTLAAVTAATKIGGPVSVFVAGTGAADVAKEFATVVGVDEVIWSGSATYDHAVAENVSKGLAELQASKNFTHVLTSATNEGRNIMPRLAALLDVGAVSDVIEIKSEDTFVRPMYAGSAIATVKSKDAVKLLSVRPTNFDKAEIGGGTATITEFAGDADAGKSKWVSDEVVKSDRPALAGASVVIAGGRGMKSGDNFEMLYKLADKMGAAVGASRAAVDAGFVANELQIGQTGKVVAPDLYVAVGISGAIQHMAGMKDSKTIVCINKDGEAPIFQVSDYGLEADLFTAVPELTEKV